MTRWSDLSKNPKTYHYNMEDITMDYKDLNAFEIVERSIMQCKEENDSILTHESVDFFMQSGLNDDM